MREHRIGRAFEFKERSGVAGPFLFAAQSSIQMARDSTYGGLTEEEFKVWGDEIFKTVAQEPYLPYCNEVSWVLFEEFGFKD